MPVNCAGAASSRETARGSAPGNGSGQDLDSFHDTPERVATAYDADRQTLEAAGYDVAYELTQPGYIRAVVRRDSEATKVEWAYDSSWRFMPVIRSDAFGYQRRPPDEAGCLYYAPERQLFVDPDRAGSDPVVRHYGQPGGVLPRILDEPT